jgi:hypothetical protein
MAVVAAISGMPRLVRLRSRGQFVHSSWLDPSRQSLRPSRLSLRLPVRLHLPLRTPSAPRPRITSEADDDSGRRASSSNLFPTSTAISPNNNNNLVSKDCSRGLRSPSLLSTLMVILIATMITMTILIHVVHGDSLSCP